MYFTPFHLFTDFKTLFAHPNRDCRELQAISPSPDCRPIPHFTARDAVGEGKPWAPHMPHVQMRPKFLPYFPGSAQFVPFQYMIVHTLRGKNDPLFSFFSFPLSLSRFLLLPAGRRESPTVPIWDASSLPADWLVKIPIFRSWWGPYQSSGLEILSWKEVAPCH